MTDNIIIPHLFRSEYSKLVSVLTRSFGIEYIEIAEDIASDTFLTALETWPYSGTPANPTAWLYTVAKNKLKNHLLRNRTFNEKVAEKLALYSPAEEISVDFSDTNIADSQLQMLFAICHPSNPPEAQIGLALRILCGFGLSEIASAFLTNKEAIHKRLQRAKQKLLSSNIKLEIPDDKAINGRLNVVTRAIYLLFSEGYYSEDNNTIIRKDLCVEALNLTYLLLRNPLTNTHITNALMSLMCFQASRLEARHSINGSTVLYDDQDRQLWDAEFVEKGFYYLQQSSKWDVTSTYYIEASIAYWHTVDNNHPEKWPSILKLYDILLELNNSPMVALNRVWPYSKVHGNLSAIGEAEKLQLITNHFYFILLAELNRQISCSKAHEYLVRALQLCRTDTEREMIREKIRSLQPDAG